MRKLLLQFVLAATAACAASIASASVIQSFGAGSAVVGPAQVANFELNTTLSNNYVENGLLLSWFGGTANGGCGYAGVNCYDPGDAPGPAFSGNYMSANGNNAYVSIKKANLADFFGVELAVGSNFLSFNGFWQTFNNTVQTGAGNFLMPTSGILGLSDTLGFDEVRLFTFASANRTSGFSSAAIDAVRVAAVVPEPASLALLCAGLFGFAARRKGERK
jgi:hypothetical protein